MDKIITVLGYENFITEMSYAPDCMQDWNYNLNASWKKSSVWQNFV